MGVNRFLAFKVSHFSTVCLCGSEFPTRGYESTKFASGGLVHGTGGLQNGQVFFLVFLFF